MKAIVLQSFGSPENFLEQELAAPALHAGEVLIDVKAASFNPVDCQIRRNGPRVPGRPLHSMILGRDLSGTVAAVADGVEGLAVGDDVYSYVATISSSGTYAEQVSVPAELVARKPESLTHAQAAAVPVAGITASLAVSKARVSEAGSVFVGGGAGGVGTFAIMLARALGIRRIVTTAGSPEARAYLGERLGVQDEDVIDYRVPGFADAAIARNGGPFDSVLDLVGGGMLSACCSLVATDGHLASVVDGPAAGEDVDRLFDRNVSFHLVGANAYSLDSDRRAWRRYRAMLDQLAAAFDGGKLRPPQVEIVGPFTAKTVTEAHRWLEAGGVQGKLVMAR